MEINRDTVIRLEKDSEVKAVEINRGLVWLTGTPANGDILLKPGDHFELTGNWPFVIQALENTKLSLVRDGRKAVGLTLKFRERQGGRSSSGLSARASSRV